MCQGGRGCQEVGRPPSPTCFHWEGHEGEKVEVQAFHTCSFTRGHGHPVPFLSPTRLPSVLSVRAVLGPATLARKPGSLSSVWEKGFLVGVNGNPGDPCPHS